MIIFQFSMLLFSIIIYFEIKPVKPGLTKYRLKFKNLFNPLFFNGTGLGPTIDISPFKTLNN